MHIKLTKFFCELILLTDTKYPSLKDKLGYLAKMIYTFGPVVYFLDTLDSWFENNQDFTVGVIVCIIFNLIIGVITHLKFKSFSWMEFITGNSMMILAIIVVYALLEILRSRIGENIVSESFKIIIQVATLLFPISKVCKNVYILTNKQHPPKFIMERIYNFEQTGDVTDLFNPKKPEDNDRL